MSETAKTRKPRKTADAAADTSTQVSVDVGALQAQIAALQAQIAALQEGGSASVLRTPGRSEEFLDVIEEYPKNDTRRQLESALLSERRKAASARALAERAADEPVYEVKNVIDQALSVGVTNARGEEILVQFQKKGAVQYLTAGQIVEIRERAPHFFEKGYLHAPEIITPTANMIEDFDMFLAELEPSEIHTRIRAIDSEDVLMSLFHHIDGLRFRVEGDVLVQVQIDPKTQMVQHAVIDRVRGMSGIQLAVDPSR